MQGIIQRLSKHLNFMLKWYIVFLMAALVVLTFLQVFFRYVVGSPITGTEELSRIALVWVTFIGAAEAVRRKKLIRIEVIEERFPPKLKSFLAAMFDYILMMLCGVIVVKGWESMEITSSQMIVGTPFSFSCMLLAVVVGCALMFVYIGLRRFGHLISEDKAVI